MPEFMEVNDDDDWLRGVQEGYASVQHHDDRYRAWAARPANEDRILIYLMRYSRLPDGLAVSAFATFGINAGITWNFCKPYAEIEPFFSLSGLVFQAANLGFADMKLIDHLLQLGTNLAELGELQCRDE